MIENEKRYLLDSDVIIDHLRGKEKIPEGIVKCVLYISAGVYGELYTGVHKSTNPEKTKRILLGFLSKYHIAVISINEIITEKYAEIRAILEKKGNKRDSIDLYTAATAIVHKLILITNNKKHFSDIKDLLIL